MSNPINIIKVVKIAKDRGYGSGMFSVIAQTNLTDCDGEYTLIPYGETTRKNKFNIYKAHCFTDRDTIRATVEAMAQKKEIVKKIGLK